MKKLWILLALSLAVACGISGSKKVIEMKTGKNLVNYKFKVDGLQDSTLSDTIWKMIFQVKGIDKLIISKTDSSVLFSVNDSLLNQQKLMTEIEKRGGKILNE